MDGKIITAKIGPTSEKPETGESLNYTLPSLHRTRRTGNAVSFRSEFKSLVSLEQNKTKSVSLKSRTYNVQKGDTLSHIAVALLKESKAQITSKSIADAVVTLSKVNKIKDPNLIFPGQKISYDAQVFQGLKTDNSQVQPFKVVKELQPKGESVTKYSPELSDNKSYLKPEEIKTLDNKGFGKKSSELASTVSESLKFDVRDPSIGTFTQRKKHLNPLESTKIDDSIIRAPASLFLQKTLERATSKGYIKPEELNEINTKIKVMAESFNFQPDDFAKVVLMESDGFNPRASNGSCHGIIQFCDGKDRGAASIGLSDQAEKILELSVIDQLDLVAQYFEDTELRSYGPASIDDLYLTVLSPAARFVANKNVPLPISGKQAKVLHVGGSVDAPITRSSIINGLSKHAWAKLSGFLSSTENQDRNFSEKPLAFSSSEILKKRY
jgi:LysM repeat protein